MLVINNFNGVICIFVSMVSQKNIFALTQEPCIGKRTHITEIGLRLLDSSVVVSLR